MARVEGKVALITGAARGMGRSHAVRLAGEGADIIALDLVGRVASVEYSPAVPSDLEETAALVRQTGRRIVVRQGDVRRQADLDEAVAAGLDAFGRLDIVIANAGIASFAPATELSEAMWQDVIDINLTGVWHTVKAAVPPMVAAGAGGSIVLVSSTAGLAGPANLAHYASAKHGLVGLMRVLSNELAPHSIRVNTVHPAAVATEMVLNSITFRAFRPDLEDPTYEDAREAMMTTHNLPVATIDPVDISNAILFLVSDEARYITGVTLPIDAGALSKWS